MPDSVVFNLCCMAARTWCFFRVRMRVCCCTVCLCFHLTLESANSSREQRFKLLRGRLGMPQQATQTYTTRIACGFTRYVSILPFVRVPPRKHNPRALTVPGAGPDLYPSIREPKPGRRTKHLLHAVRQLFLFQFHGLLVVLPKGALKAQQQ